MNAKHGGLGNMRINSTSVATNLRTAIKLQEVIKQGNDKYV